MYWIVIRPIIAKASLLTILLTALTMTLEANAQSSADPTRTQVAALPATAPSPARLRLDLRTEFVMRPPAVAQVRKPPLYDIRPETVSRERRIENWRIKFRF